MPRRIIATAEVQVAADVKQAEVGIDGLTDVMRQFGVQSERAAARMEAAFFQGATSATAGFKKISAATRELLDEMRQTDAQGKKLADGYESAVTAANKLARTNINAANEKALDTLRQVAAAAGVVESGLHIAGNRAAHMARQILEAEDAAKAVADEAKRLERVFRDVGQEIEVAMRGGQDGLETDIRKVINRLNDMGGEARDAARIAEAAFNDLTGDASLEVDEVRRALLRLSGQLSSVEGTALRQLEGDARQAAIAMGQLDRAADRTDRALAGMTNRVSGNMRGVIGLLGAAGIGMAAQNMARFGLDMTIQLEKAGAMFEGLTGSVEGAGDMLERMVRFAQDTPYNLANVTDAAAQLLAVGDGFGVTTSNLEDFLTTFGEAITMTGGGDEQFTRLVRVFGQMSSSGKVLGQDMNQLAQNLPGYDVWQALADGTNKSVKELRQLQDLGKLDELLTGNEAVTILLEGMKQIPGAAGAMERRMNTLGGALEKFKETAQFAMSQGLIPFAETAQDTLSDPVILTAVQDLSEAFGALLSEGLAAIAPELDDLAAAGEEFLIALQDWTPVLAIAVDILGDFLGAIAPIVSGLGELAAQALGAGDGIGKMVIGAGLMFTGPLGIAVGTMTAISGAIDYFGGANEEAANTARLLAAAQTEVNIAMGEGEGAIYSEAQQRQLDIARDLMEVYPALVNGMQAFGLTTEELYAGMQTLASGTGTVSTEMQALIDHVEAARNSNVGTGAEIIGQFDTYMKAVGEQTDAVAVATAEETALHELAATAEMGAREEAAANRAEYYRIMEEQQQAYRDSSQAAVEDEAAILAELIAAEDERAAAMQESLDAEIAALEESVTAYETWAEGINSSTDSAKLSLSSVASDAENSVSGMIDALNLNTASVNHWQGNIVTAAGALHNVWGVPADEAENFMTTLADMGIEAGPALDAMLLDMQAGGTQLLDFFNANKANAEAFGTDMTAGFEEATGAVPSLAEKISEGTATVDEILAELPTLVETYGGDMEASAAAISMVDEMRTVGTEAVAGLVGALNGGTARVAAAAAALANAGTIAVGNKWEVASPSRVWFEMGEFAVEGLIGGLQSLSDEAYAVAAGVASMMTGGIADHFADAEDPQEEARKFAEDVSKSIVDELIAEQDNVADAAEALAEAAADRLAEAWDRVKDRFHTRDMAEAVADAQADLAEAQSELAAARSLAGASGTAAIASAQSRLAEAERVLANAVAVDASADLAADQAFTDYKRRQDDESSALVAAQKSEMDAIARRIDAANRNLDPVARRAAEEDLAAAKARHEAEKTALDRRQEDEANEYQRRLDAENDIREAAIKAQEDQVNAFESALEDVVDAVADAITDMADLVRNVSDAERDVQDAFLDQFERMLETLTEGQAATAAGLGAQAGLSPQEYNDLIYGALAANAAQANANAHSQASEDLLGFLSSGLYTIGAGGAVGIAAGISGEAHWIASSMIAAVQAAVNAALAALQIQSPSKVTARLIGRPMAEGIAAGLTDTIPAVGSAMTGLLDSVMYGRPVPSSQLVDRYNGPDSTITSQPFGGPLVTMPGAIIQDATDADLVAQRVMVALQATGMV